jgi:ATP-dependent RNA helicase DOB1
LLANPMHEDEILPGALAIYDKKMAVKEEARQLKRAMKVSSEMILKEELKGMKRVLRRLGMLNSDNVVEAKGRVACEVDSADELVVTELIFNNSFSDLTVEQLVALCSCFVFGEKAKEDAGAGLEEALLTPLRMLQDVAKRVAKLKIESKLALDETEYVNTFDPTLMKVAYEWCKGAKFCDIIKLTEVFEGSIIRAMRRLEELLRQLCSAANSIGNDELEAKFNEGIRLIKRDIIFAASLYL